jgi:hypothetical protein
LLILSLDYTTNVVLGYCPDVVPASIPHHQTSLIEWGLKAQNCKSNLVLIRQNLDERLKNQLPRPSSDRFGDLF